MKNVLTTASVTAVLLGFLIKPDAAYEGARKAVGFVQRQFDEAKRQEERLLAETHETITRLEKSMAINSFAGFQVDGGRISREEIQLDLNVLYKKRENLLEKAAADVTSINAKYKPDRNLVAVTAETSSVVQSTVDIGNLEAAVDEVLQKVELQGAQICKIAHDVVQLNEGFARNESELRNLGEQQHGINLRLEKVSAEVDSFELKTTTNQARFVLPATTQTAPRRVFCRGRAG